MEGNEGRFAVLDIKSFDENPVINNVGFGLKKHRNRLVELKREFKDQGQELIWEKLAL